MSLSNQQNTWKLIIIQLHYTKVFKTCQNFLYMVINFIYQVMTKADKFAVICIGTRIQSYVQTVLSIDISYVADALFEEHTMGYLNTLDVCDLFHSYLNPLRYSDWLNNNLKDSVRQTKSLTENSFAEVDLQLYELYLVYMWEFSTHPIMCLPIHTYNQCIHILLLVIHMLQSIAIFTVQSNSTIALK